MFSPQRSVLLLRRLDRAKNLCIGAVTSVADTKLGACHSLVSDHDYRVLRRLNHDWNVISVMDTACSEFGDRFLTIHFKSPKTEDLRMDARTCGGYPCS
jgi:hypothetical protein